MEHCYRFFVTVLGTYCRLRQEHWDTALEALRQSDPTENTPLLRVETLAQATWETVQGRPPTSSSACFLARPADSNQVRLIVAAHHEVIYDATWAACGPLWVWRLQVEQLAEALTTAIPVEM